MKVIKYKHCNMVNLGTEKDPKFEEIFSNVEIGWNEVNEEIAKKEAYNGVYEILEVEEESDAPLSLAERVEALERVVSVADYVVGKWYYRGDKMKFNGTVYTCVAPVGVVCVWNPEEYPQYWEVS